MSFTIPFGSEVQLLDRICLASCPNDQWRVGGVCLQSIFTELKQSEWCKAGHYLQ